MYQLLKSKKNLVPIYRKEFREVAKGCGIKYRNKIPSEEFKAVLRYLPLYRRRNVEVRDGTQFCKVYDSIKEAVKDFGISNSSSIQYAIDHERPWSRGDLMRKNSGLEKLKKLNLEK